MARRHLGPKVPRIRADLPPTSAASLAEARGEEAIPEVGHMTITLESAGTQQNADRSRHVVVGIDGSPNSLAALRRAVYRAREHGADIELVHVIPAGSDAAAVAAARAMLGMAVRCEFPGGLEIPARFTVETGDPAEMLVKRSADAGLLVIGGRSSPAGGGLLDGDVVPYCLIHSGCPVDVCADHRRAA
jgi:nucleotide-binding universal stress UspA family protein